MTKAVLQTRQDLPLLGEAAPEIGLRDFEPSCGPAAALVVAVQCTSQFCLQRLDLFADGAYLLFEGFAFGIGNQAVLGFRRSAILNDLVNGIVLGKKLETILLPPTQPQTVDDLGRASSGHQIGEHRNLLSVVAHKQNRAHRSHGLQASLLFQEAVAVPLPFKREPATMKPLPWILPARAPAFQISNETNARSLQEAESVSAIPAPVEYQREWLVTMHATDLSHGAGKGARQRVVQGLRKKEQHPTFGVMQVDVSMAFGRQPAFAVPSFRRRMLTEIGAEMSVDVIQALPNRLQCQITLQHVS